MATNETERIEHLALVSSGSKLLPQHFGRAGQDGECTEVAWDDIFHTQHLAGVGGLARVHREVITYRQDGKLGAEHLAVQFHVPEDGCVA